MSARRKRKPFDAAECVLCRWVKAMQKDWQQWPPVIAINGIPVCVSHSNLLRDAVMPEVEYSIRPLDSGGEAARKLLQRWVDDACRRIQ